MERSSWKLNTGGFVSQKHWGRSKEKFTEWLNSDVPDLKCVIICIDTEK